MIPTAAPAIDPQAKLQEDQPGQPSGDALETAVQEQDSDKGADGSSEEEGAAPQESEQVLTQEEELEAAALWRGGSDEKEG